MSNVIQIVGFLAWLNLKYEHTSLESNIQKRIGTKSFLFGLII